MRPGYPIFFAGCLSVGLAIMPLARAQTVDEWYTQGVKARQEQRFDESVAFLRRVLERQPENVDALVQVGFSQLGRDDLPAARAAFSVTLSLAPDYADAKFGLAQVEFRSGNLKSALAIVEPIVAEQPENDEAAALLSSIRSAMEAEGEEAAAPSPAPVEEAPSSSPDVPTPALPDPVAALIAEGTRLRTAGKFVEAERVYRRALALAPRNTDILVALGLVAGFQQKFDEAASLFNSALAIDPNILDARLGLVRLAIYQSEIGRARTLIDEALVRAPDNAEALVIEARIAFLEGDYERAEQSFQAVAAADPERAEAFVGLGDVRRAMGDEAAARKAYQKALLIEPGSRDIENRLNAPPPRLWRLDTGSEVSVFSPSRGHWTDSSVVISHRVTPTTTIAARTRLATRFGQTDTQIEARIDHAFTPSFSAYGLMGATPEADFLARVRVGAGGSWRAIADTNGYGPLYLNLDARHEVFSDSEVTTISPWVQAYIFSQRLGLSARWVRSEDDIGTVADGYVLRADLTVTDRFRLFSGYADAPEISEGLLIDTRTMFGGLAFDITDQITVRGNFAHEIRPTYDRDTTGVGLTLRF